ncbi:uncharacterized protein LOC134798006 [Cydia splendana]|uniref:uncharacterized protein LOC134798006 n=1 Tax=Cydia splendana TaxID=1100963 RepID=UPI00300C3B80
MPPELLNVSSWRHLKDLDLADPSFHKSGPIDMLVNVNLFAAALQSGVVKGNADEPIAVRTVFGWLVMGECPIIVNTSRSRCHKGSEGDTQRCYLVSSLSLDNNIKRFWELESVDPPKNIVLSKSEMSCENQMETSYCRTPEGRMVVPLTYVDPQDKPRFSNCREIALKRLLNLERKFKLNPQFRTAYVNFMDDYLSCGHMVEVDPPLSSEDQLHNFENVHDLSLKILGLSWLPKEDTFTFKTSLNDCRCTKRSILSDIARIFDPLGLLSPVVFFAKYLIQLLWVSGVDWDSEVPIAIAQEWRKFKSQLAEMSSLSIPRRMVVSFVSLQLHGYCDASEKGYCAVIYCRVVQNDGSVVVRLCCAKTKVAPLRKCSIPRCELLAAVLLSDLIVSFTEAVKDFHTFDDIHAWSDSTVALTWIRSCPSKWKTFVANRVAHIQENVPPENWHHVSGSDNPADCGSRGLLPADLIQNTLWWAGPTWLSNPQESWPESEIFSDQAASNEQKIYSLFTDSNISLIDNMLSRFSSLQRILRIFAYCFRFMHNLQKSSSKITDPNLSSEEITKVLHFLVKRVQERAFASELRCLLTDKSTHSLSKPMRKLAPFVDERGMLRIEAMLNSRPLSPVSSDPNDLSVLTPGHFLTLEPLTILPESNMVDAKLGPLQRWKLLQKIHQDFWRKWHVEYLHTLQQRHKWFDSQKNIVVGTLVLIVNEQCSPMKWKIGRRQLHDDVRPWFLSTNWSIVGLLAARGCRAIIQDGAKNGSRAKIQICRGRTMLARPPRDIETRLKKK